MLIFIELLIHVFTSFYNIIHPKIAKSFSIYKLPFWNDGNTIYEYSYNTYPTGTYIYCKSDLTEKSRVFEQNLQFLHHTQEIIKYFFLFISDEWLNLCDIKSVKLHNLKCCPPMEQYRIFSTMPSEILNE